MDYQNISLEKKDRVARITLNRPEVMNAVDTQMLEELLQELELLKDAPEVKALVITGDERAFSTGADIKMIATAYARNYQIYVDFLTKFDEVCLALMEHPLPAIAMVKGYALAGGLELMLSCDIAIAAEDATIGDQHMNYGMTGGPDLWLVPQRVGMQRALELILTGKWLSGKEAEDYGLVLKAVPKERLEEELEVILSNIRHKSRSAAAMVKKLVRGTWHLSAGEAVDRIYANDIHYMTTEEAKEGVQSFVGKRQPRFK